MFRKLILLAITSGLARKAWDSYRRKGASPFARARTGVRPRGGWFS
jgi:hypothetical protein